jgi:hypothetical protein
MKTLTAILLVSFLLSVSSFSQNLKFRSGGFLHHSTGECIWGPNGSSTSVPQQMVIYNSSHGFTGTNAVTMSELWWPAEDDNEWCRWHRIFNNQDTGANIQPLYASNRIIVIKSCFPSSNVEAWGVPGDTTDPEYKTVLNYKWHWRNIIKVMRAHPQNFFVIWTNAPLVPSQTNSTESFFAHCFCKWAKDTLAAGLDPVTGNFPQNVYVFDFFHKLTGSNWMMLLQYAQGSEDSHPNAAATQLVAPQFVNEMFNASINYEQVYGIIKLGEYTGDYKLYQNYPNPFNPSTKIRFNLPFRGFVNLTVFDSDGKTVSILFNGYLQGGEYETEFQGLNLSSGVYYYKISTGNFSVTKKMILIK